jgi:hypothetical protein
MSSSLAEVLKKLANTNMHPNAHNAILSRARRLLLRLVGFGRFGSFICLSGQSHFGSFLGKPGHVYIGPIFHDSTARHERRLTGEHFWRSNVSKWPGTASCPNRAESRDVGRPQVIARASILHLLQCSLGFAHIFPETPTCAQPDSV